MDSTAQRTLLRPDQVLTMSTVIPGWPAILGCTDCTGKNYVLKNVLVKALFSSELGILLGICFFVKFFRHSRDAKFNIFSPTMGEPCPKPNII